LLPLGPAPAGAQRAQPAHPEGLRLEELIGREWLLADGLGGYASLSTILCPTRRQQGLLVAPYPGSAGRHLFLSRFEESVHGEDLGFPLSVARYPGTWAPLGHRGFTDFQRWPWPTLRHHIGRAEIVREILVPRGRHAVLCRWTLKSKVWPLELRLRPLTPYRAADSLTFENPHLDPRAQRLASAHGIQVRLYAGMPALFLTGSGPGFSYHADPVWYRRLQYLRDLERGYAGEEDQFSPGLIQFRLPAEGSVVVAAALDEAIPDPVRLWQEESARLQARQPAAPAGLCATLAATADDFLYRAPGGRLGVIAGYPWFGEWGRDTLIALPGLTLARGMVKECGEALTGLVPFLRDGLLPNVFGERPESSHWNSADAALWFARAVRLWELDAGAAGREQLQDLFAPALARIAEGYENGGRLDLRVDEEGLLHAGNQHLNATWMDAQFDGVPVTPRHGAAVELNALWYFLLTYLERLALERGDRAAARHWMERRRRSRAGFLKRLWLPDEQRLADLWRDGVADRSVRPNMVIAAALEFSPLSRGKRTDVVRHAGKFLLTPMGLRTLAPDDEAFEPRYAGGPRERDLAYHQGTVWPWLLGFYVEAHLRAFGAAPANLERLRAMLDGIAPQLECCGLGHVSEVADGDPPHRPGGTIAQAWNSGELLRACRMLAEGKP
jgi:predicted glycogen debranching enzyme